MVERCAPNYQFSGGGRCDRQNRSANLCGASHWSRSTGSKILFSAFAAKSVGDANGGWQPVRCITETTQHQRGSITVSYFIPAEEFLLEKSFEEPDGRDSRDHRTRGTRSGCPRRGSQISNGYLHASLENINACAPLSRAILRTHPPAGTSRQRSR